MVRIVERDASGVLREVQSKHSIEVKSSNTQNDYRLGYYQKLIAFLSNVFLPDGYPNTVSPDYTRYQILNVLQVFCSSLSGMLSSRATLQSYGVGSAGASATDALLLSVLQDVFGRFTTIAAAYYYGSSFMPEAKTYRFLADILNDIAIVLDTLSPFLASLPISLALVRIVPIPFTAYTLCLSASLRALCGMCAGGARTALSLHFATPIEGRGDLGDLNAKYASIETVLGLMGMFLGTVVVPYLTTPFSTYTTLFVLIALHLAFNYYAVRGVRFRTLNRQRATLAWLIYRSKNDEASRSIPSPDNVARLERLFQRPDVMADPFTGTFIGRCTIGSSIGSVLKSTTHSSIPIPPPRILETLKDEKYVLWFDPESISNISSTISTTNTSTPHLHIFLRDGHEPFDHLKAWLHAAEVLRAHKGPLEAEKKDLRDQVAAALKTNSALQFDPQRTSTHWDPSESIISAFKAIQSDLSGFVKTMIQEKWVAVTDHGGEKLEANLMTGPPAGVISEIVFGSEADISGSGETRKDV